MNPSMERANSIITLIMWHSFFQADVHSCVSSGWASCSMKLEEERAAKCVPSCFGHMPGWIPALGRRGSWTMPSFTKLLLFCRAGTAGADPLFLSCEDVICLGRPLYSMGQSLDFLWFSSATWLPVVTAPGRAEERGPWATWKHPLSPHYLCADSQHCLFHFQDADFLANSLWCYVASNEFLFSVDSPWCIKSILKCRRGA